MTEVLLNQGKSLKLGYKGQELSRLLHPLRSYKLMREFLLLWKRLQLFKNNWGTSRYEIDEINNAEIYKTFQLVSLIFIYIYIFI